MGIVALSWRFDPTWRRFPEQAVDKAARLPDLGMGDPALQAQLQLQGSDQHFSWSHFPVEKCCTRKVGRRR